VPSYEKTIYSFNFCNNFFLVLNFDKGMYGIFIVVGGLGFVEFNFLTTISV
jgi:hypothetical protein